MTERKFDLVVIGGGPGGYVAAIRAAQLGFKVACVEQESSLGGTCLNIGCIPSKALLESSEHYEVLGHGLSKHGIRISGLELDLSGLMKRKKRIVTSLTKGVSFLFKKNKVEHILGTGRLVGQHEIAVQGEGGGSLRAEKILLATGSLPANLKGIELRGPIGTSTEALSYEEIPSHLVVIGAGAIGLELGTVWRRLGAKVTVLEYLDHILPGVDGEVGQMALRVLKKQGMEFHLSTRVTGARVDGNACSVQVADGDPITADRVLVAVGRVPCTANLNLEEVGVAVNERGFIQVDDSYQTSVGGIFAIGDVIGGPMLAHKASEEAIACIEKIATGYGRVNYDAIPSVVYTAPEVASVGQTESALTAAGIPFRKGVFQFRANGRAMTLDQTDGFVKILAHEETDRVLGVHIIGPRAGDLIAEAAAAIEFCASSEDVARICHAHPTLSEALQEAALDVSGQAIHM